MGVSTRNMLVSGLALAGLVGFAGVAAAGGEGCGAGCAPSGPKVVIPGAGVGQPTVGFGQPGGMAPKPRPCCGDLPGGHGVIVPGVNIAGPNVTVGAPNVTINQGNIVFGGSTVLDTGIVVTGEAGQTFIAGGGGGFAGPVGLAPSAIDALSVSGGEERYTETVMEKVAVKEEVCVERASHALALRPVQAVCLDDTGTPHPASRVDPADRVDPHYKGELFRCMAGTHMQVTLGRIDGRKATFAQADTFSCRKGEALVHRPGGELSCAPQAPERDCNERSLLRRHGPGIKYVETPLAGGQCVPETRTVMKSVPRQVERVRAAPAGPIVFDGGVGQGVY